MILSAQLRAARSLLGWSQATVAQAAGLSIPTVKRAEGAGSIPASSAATEAIRAALEAAGVIFLDENGGGPGVRLARPGQDPEERSRPG
jgi:transcriptional regulator with XRE-family HTH domain